MKLVGPFIALLTLGSCGQNYAVDCEQVRVNLDRCLGEVSGKGSDHAWEQCIPYSVPERITGEFASAFEFNEFREMPLADQEDPWSVPPVSTKLHIDRPAFTNAAGEKIGTVTRITFEGRRPLCVVAPQEKWLIVDRVISEKIISTAPFGP